MILGLAIPDYAVLGACLAVVLGIGVWAGRRRTSSDDFLLAGRATAWWPLGASLAVGGGLAVYYCLAPGEASWAGLKLLLAPALLWAALPIVFWCVIPLAANLRLDSIYEYLELRYSPATRAVAGGVYLAGTLLWLGGVLVLPCQVLRLDVTSEVPVAGLLVVMGVVVACYTYLGGMKAAVWTDVLQLALMVAAVLVLLVAVAMQLPENDRLGRVWEVTQALGRSDFTVAPHPWSQPWIHWAADWSIWAAVPYLALLPMFFFVADQATLQRLLAARGCRDMQLVYLIGCGVFTLIVPAAMAVGLGLLTVYHDQAQAEIPPQWVVHAATDPQTGRPLLGPDAVIDADTVGKLVADGLILDPNTNRPLADTDGLVNARGQVVIDRLATRATRQRGGERRLRAGGDLLLARFLRRHLPFGLAGLILAAMVAAVMATLDSGITGLATLVVIDFHRRFGWAERWLAGLCGKPPDALDQTDELRLARPVVLGLTAAVVAVSLVVAELGNPIGFVLGVLGVLAGPLLGILLLGFFTQRTTGPAAVAGLALGMLTALWATLGHRLAPAAAPALLWPFDGPLGPFWPLIFGLAATLAAGYCLGFLLGPRRSRRELTGLVVGLGPLGILLPVEPPGEETEDDEEVIWIETRDDDPGDGPWS
ncbi:MAG: hypothetical protein JXB62_08440 [Pirellulales bacterium]|nr:hypothetical protein [Pirellulales bacterium]